MRILRRCTIIFYFSSKLYKDKFRNNVNDIDNKVIQGLKNKMVLGDFQPLIEIAYYKQIEKRGFYIKIINKEKELVFDSYEKLIISIDIQLKEINNDSRETIL